MLNAPVYGTGRNKKLHVMFAETDTNTYHLKPTALIIDPPRAGPAHSTESDTGHNGEKTGEL